MLNRITQQFKGDSLKSNLMRGGLASIAIKIFGLCFSLLTAIILARTLGPEQYGVYSYVLAIVSILAIPAMFGLPSLIVRETAKAEVKQEWGKMRGLWFWSNSITASLSVAIAIIAAFVLWFNRESFTEMQFLTFAWGIAFIPLSALAALRGASLRGLRKVIQGQLPEQVVKPALFILMLAVVGLTGFTQLTAERAMMLNALSAGMAFIFGAWLLWRVKPQQLASVEKEYERKAWMSSVIPLAMISGVEIFITQTDVIMLGWFDSAENVGIYRISLQGAQLSAFGIAVTNMVAMPYMSKFSHSKNINSLKKLAKQSARAAFLIAILSTMVFYIYGELIIKLVFGENYINAYYPLLLLSVGQVIHAGMGAGGTILNMSGREKGTLITLVFSGILNVILNYIFIPLWGIEGAALATLIAIVFRKIVIWLIVLVTFKIDSSMFGVEFKRT